MYLTQQLEIPKRAGINLFDIQPFIDPGDLTRVIKGFAEARGCLFNSLNGDTPPPEQRVPLKDKNRINGLSAEYAGSIQKYIKQFSSVEEFLAAPENQSYLRPRLR